MDVLKLVNEAEEKLEKEFKQLDKLCEINSLKVLDSFHKNEVSEIHFNSTTGYGYGDIGRDTIEDIFKDIFKAEDALVRNQLISGSHALTVTLFALLRPGDTLLSITGKPYDTLDEVIGIKENESSLMSYGIKYDEIDLVDNKFDIEKIQEYLKNNKVKVIEIQRSRGYSTRKSITIDELEEVIKKIREVDKEVIIMIDNCYCEFVSEKEPIEVGADIAVGSLIKNLGGGIAPNGAYIVGRKDLIKLAAERLTLPGEGKEVGPTLGINKSFLQGIYMAPSVVKNSLKTVVLASQVLEDLGYNVEPNATDIRADIVEMITFNDSDKLIKFVQGIQKGSAIDSHVTPYPWAMPGYSDEVIMAAGAFNQGSSIELSADAPIKEPYILYMQGGLTYESGKYGIMVAAADCLTNN